MSVISYSGKFGKYGDVINETNVNVQCPLCQRRRTISYKQYKAHSDVCQLCVKHGPPIYREDAIKLHPNITNIITFGVRGDVVSESMVVVICASCNRELEARYDHVTEIEEWKCASCALLARRERPIFPDDLPGYVLDYERDTLAANGEVLIGTIIFTQCATCPNVVRKTWGATKLGGKGNRVCQNCAHARPWQSPEYKKRMLETDQHNGALSKLHQSVKSAIEANGISGFVSERFVGGFARVDELNSEKRVILEVYGDWWHFNPAKYDANKKAFRNGKNVIAGEIWESNRKRIDRLVSLGYSVYIMWESEFRDNPTQAIEDFKEWLQALPAIRLEVQTSRDE